MIGILPEKVRGLFSISEGFEAWTGLAIGDPGDLMTLPEHLKER
jgi:hypothetical protein